jgi:hypothetical protein
MSVSPVFLEPGPVEPGPVLPYQRWDLTARRAALGLQPEQLAPVLQIGLTKYRSRETGSLPAPPGLVKELIAMEDFVAEQTAKLLDEAPAAGTVSLQALAEQDEFTATYPDARTLRGGIAYPLTLQHVAVGRAAGELSRRGRDVEVHRGSRRADLAVRRLATGQLKKNLTAIMLRVEEKSYYSMERGSKPARPRLLAELQAIDDFINTTAAQLAVTEIDHVGVVYMIDDQQRFEQAYPQARTLRDGVAYPVRVHHVAAARRAHQLEATGKPARIIHQHRIRHRGGV